MPADQPHLQRRFGFLQATALNMSNMVGVGPFITIPLLMSALMGPQSLLGWFVALIICLADGLIWAELGAALPGSGGSYIFLREAFGPRTWGRLMAFLFIWQFILSGPMEIATGYIGFCNYLEYIWPNRWVPKIGILSIDPIAILMAVLTIALLYRRIATVGKITVTLWIGTLITTGAVILLGAFNFDAKKAFDFPPGAFSFSAGFLVGLGAAARVGIYDYLGYYDICYIGDEVRDPGRVIPRSILISLVAVALIYIGINLSIIGTIPWREFVTVPGATPNAASKFVVSVFVERLLGRNAAILFTGLILWTAVGSIFALMLGYSRIPYAAALDGYFFRVFGKLHPTKNFPYISLLFIGIISIVFTLFPLGMVIDALITTRILIQFVGQAAGVMLLRQRLPANLFPFRMWLYPLPCAVAIIGWTFLFATTDFNVILAGVGMLWLGLIAFFIWSYRNRTWPFGIQETEGAAEKPTAPSSKDL